jgi:prepilin-type processing-associated H-X9-DG protein
MIENPGQPENAGEHGVTATPLSYADQTFSNRARSKQAQRVILVGVVAVIVLGLIVVMSGALDHPREQNNRVICTSNLKWIAQCAFGYAGETQGMLPPSFDELLATQDITPECFNCPASNDQRAVGPTTQAMLQDFHKRGHLSYVYALGAVPRSSVTAAHVLAYEPLQNHRDGIQAVFGDGHVENL